MRLYRVANKQLGGKQTMSFKSELAPNSHSPSCTQLLLTYSLFWMSGEWPASCMVDHGGPNLIRNNGSPSCSSSSSSYSHSFASLITSHFNVAIHCSPNQELTCGPYIAKALIPNCTTALEMEVLPFEWQCVLSEHKEIWHWWSVQNRWGLCVVFWRKCVYNWNLGLKQIIVFIVQQNWFRELAHELQVVVIVS